MTATQTAYIGLGANLDSIAGTPEATVRAAILSLRSLGDVVACSSLYATAPVGIPQPPFINAVASLRTSCSPEPLLEKLLEIERSFGRERDASVEKGPRTLDLDLLLVDGIVLQTERLSLPHPALAERRFVLAPLSEIAPELVHPVLGRTMRDLLAALPDRGSNSAASVRRLP